MDWKELFKNFSLFKFIADIKYTFRDQQIGLFNKIENYNITIPQEMLEKLLDTKITEALEKSAKENAFKKLEPLSSELNLLPEASIVPMVASTLATATLAIVAPSPEISFVSDKHTIKIVDND